MFPDYLSVSYDYDEIGLATFITKQIYRIKQIFLMRHKKHIFHQNILACLLHPADKYLFKVKCRNTTWMCLWSK